MSNNPTPENPSNVQPDLPRTGPQDQRTIPPVPAPIPPPPSMVSRWIGVVASVVMFLLFLSLVFFGSATNRFHWVGLYISVALLTGTLFFSINQSDGNQFNWSQFGIQFGGAAAVGAGFMTLAWWFVPQPIPTLQLISLSEINAPLRQLVTFKVAKHPGLSEKPRILYSEATGADPLATDVLVQFEQNSTDATLELTWVEPPMAKRRTASYALKRGAKTPPPTIQDLNP